MDGVRKTIPPGRDRMQSELLLGGLAMLMASKTAAVLIEWHQHGPYPRWLWVAMAVSAAFALLVWRLRSATAPAAILGGIVCLNILFAQAHEASWLRTAMPALMTLFLLTFAATRFGRKRKEQLGIAEPRRGRRASQVAANLGVAGLCAGPASPLLFAACLAVLAEATADTVSSEMGQVLGGRTLLITSGREVPRGTDGGISLAGTVLGAAAAAGIVLVTVATGTLPWRNSIVVFAAAFAGLLFDSYLGATLERRGWLGNDLVNFSSTAFSAALAYLLLGL